MVQIKDFKEKLGKLSGDDRATACGALWANLSELSHSDLFIFQANWDGTRPFEEFVAAQNEVILECLDREMSDIGVVDRQIYGLKPLDPEEVLLP